MQRSSSVSGLNGVTHVKKVSNCGFSLRQTVLETLENRRLLSVSVPSGYIKVDQFTVDAKGAVASSNVTLTSGTAYFLKASGTAVMCGDGRLIDAEYGQRLADKSWQDDDIHGLDWGLQVGNAGSGDANVNWGAYDSSHQYGLYWTGADEKLTSNLNDSPLTDNSGSLQVEVFQKVKINSLSVADANAPANSATANSSSPADFTVASDQNGDLSLDFAGTYDPQNDSAGAQVLWSVDSAGKNLAKGTLAGGDQNVSLNVVGTNLEYVATAGVDTNGNGTLDGGEVQRTINIHAKSTWNVMAPQLFNSLTDILNTESQVGAQLATLKASINTSIAQTSLVYGAYNNANQAIASSTLWSLAWGNGTTVPAITAATVQAALATPQLTNIYSSYRIIQSGVQGMKALSATTKAAIATVERVNIYGAVAAWAIDQGVNVYALHSVTDTTAALGTLLDDLNGLAQNTDDQMNDINGSYSGYEDEYLNLDGKVFTSADIANAAQLTASAGNDDTTVQSAAAATTTFINNENSALSGIQPQLTQLIQVTP